MRTRTTTTRMIAGPPATTSSQRLSIAISRLSSPFSGLGSHRLKWPMHCESSFGRVLVRNTSEPVRIGDTRQRHGNDRLRTLMVGTPRLFGRHYVRCSSLALARQYETFVALLRDFGAFPTVAANPFQAEIRQETARFAGNVSSHVPGVCSGH